MGNRFRTRVTFWLETDKPDHAVVAETIGQLKAERSFATVVRDGIMLVARLRAGDIDLLLNLFPWVEQAIIERRGSGSGEPGGGELDKLRQELDVLRQWVMNMPAAEKKPDVAAAGQGPKPLSTPTTPVPAADDDDVIVPIKKATSDGKASAENFLSSAFSLIQ